MFFKPAFIVLGSFVAAALAQTTSWCDSASAICFQRYYDQDLGVSIAVAAPETDSGEFIMEVTAPSTFGWTGVALGESMLQNLMLVVWPNGNEVMVSPRISSDYENSPPAYTGDVKITMLPDSTVNNTMVKASFRCSGCTSWTGGSLDMDSSSVTLGYAVSTVVKVNPANSISGTLFVHNQQNFCNVDLSASKTSAYSSFLKRSLVRG